MNNICADLECTGCMACMNACNHQAISLGVDNEGFYRPIINLEKCTDCALCSKVCPANKPFLEEKENKVTQMAYSAWSQDESTRLNSSSGGAFTEFAKHVLQKGGVVFGVVLDEKLVARHSYIEKECDLYLMQGSKYVQSSVDYSYKKAKSYLKQGVDVLFSGTPCQIDGLKRFLGHHYYNLFTVDFVCHGVPSPLIFEEYKSYIEAKNCFKISDVKFRCKKYSWIFFNILIKGNVEKEKGLEKEYIGTYYQDPYIRGFLRDNFLRPSCYNCKYASLKRPADITIADWWGYQKRSKLDKNFEEKGVSLILVNTIKGITVFEKVKSNFVFRVRTLEEALKTNKSLKTSFPKPKTRNEFWNDYKKVPFSQLVQKWMASEKVPLYLLLRSKYTHNYFFNLCASFLKNYCRILHRISK